MRKLLLALSLSVGLMHPSLAADLPSELTPTHGEAGISSRYLLMDANGRAVSNQDFRGRFQLLTFGYTYCPDICPTTLAEMAMVISRLGKEADGLQALFITVDPERDTADTLRDYVAFFDPRIIALTGSPALVRKAAESFKVRYEKVREPGAPEDQYAVDHSAGMYLLGPDGRFIRKFAYAMPAAKIAEQIQEIMTGNRPRSAARHMPFASQ
jgi:protein SCO1/2